MKCPICGLECDGMPADGEGDIYDFCWGCDWGDGDPIPETAVPQKPADDEPAHERS